MAPTSRPRVADIVAAAGLSNDAFYRHFQSKDALVAAILEDGGERLRSYLAHQLAKEPTPERRVRRWVAGVLAQADEDIAATTLAVLWNGSSVGDAAGRHFASTPAASLLHEPFTALGSDAPELDAALAAHATFGVLSDCLWQREQPTPAEVDRVSDFCLRGVTRLRNTATGDEGRVRRPARLRRPQSRREPSWRALLLKAKHPTAARRLLRARTSSGSR